MLRSLCSLGTIALLAALSPGAIAAPPPGACCTYTDLGVSTCAVTTRSACNQSRGVFKGANSACSTVDICPARPTGACCTSSAACSMITAIACRTAHGSYKGNTIACAADGSCPPRGACCFSSGRCTVLIEALCMSAGGDWQTAGSVCRPSPCPQPTRGACCVTYRNHAYCFVVTSTQCTGGDGTYQGDNVACTTTTCAQPVVGACCIAATTTVVEHCTVGTAAACTTAAGAYGGDGTTCLSANCPTTCACDYDHDGYLSPADFYQFFDAWIAGDADFNSSGATDRQDLIDFYDCFQNAPTGCTRAPHHH